MAGFLMIGVRDYIKIRCMMKTKTNKQTLLLLNKWTQLLLLDNRCYVYNGLSQL